MAPGRKMNTEEKAKVVAAGWGTYLNAALIIWGEHPFWKGGGLGWCEPDDHRFFYTSFSSNRPCAK